MVLTGSFLACVIALSAGAQDSTRLTAQQAVEIALQNNLSIQIAQTDLDIARINNNWGNSGRRDLYIAKIPAAPARDSCE